MAGPLAFVEIPEQLAQVPINCHIVALSPMVEIAIEETGRFYTRPEDYYDETELEEEGVANFERVEQFCRLFDDSVQHEMPLAADHKLKPARFNFWYLKVIYDAFYLRAFQLRHILHAEQPECVYRFKMPHPDLRREWFSPRESFYAPIIETLTLHTGIRCIHLPEVEVPYFDVRAVAGFPSYHRWKRAISRRFACIRDLLESICPKSNRKSVLCLDNDYNLPFIASELAKKDFAVWMWEGDCRPKRLGWPTKTALLTDTNCKFDIQQIRRFKDGFLDEIGLQEFWTWEGCKYWPIARQRLERIIDICLPEALRYSQWSKQILNDIQPDIVLTSNLADARRQAIVNVVRQQNIPVAVFFHGDLGSAHIPVLLYQNEPADLYLCYGKGTVDYMQRRSRTTSIFSVVGAPMIQQSVREAPSRRAIRRVLGLDPDYPVILYLLTVMDGNWRYISYRLPSDSTYFRIQRRIVSVLGKHPEYQMVIKDHPASAYDPLSFWVMRQEWSHIKIISSPSFPDLLHLADVVIIDMSTTAILQALQTNCALYVFNNWFRWEPEARLSLEQCAFYSDNLDAFCERLDTDLTSRRALVPRSRDDSYSRRFCYSDPNLSATQLAVEAIQQCISEKSVKR